MKVISPGIITLRFSVALLTGLCASQLVVRPALAAEFINISDIQGCRAIGGDKERLLCYDTVSAGGIFNEQQLKQAQVAGFGSSGLRKDKPAPAPAAPAATPEKSAPTVAGTVPATASEVAPVASTKLSVDRITVTIKRVKKDSRGYYYFLTTDGQVWKQRNAGVWSSDVPFEAEIKAGALGSFFLVNEGGKSTRVKRVK